MTKSNQEASTSALVVRFVHVVFNHITTNLIDISLKMIPYQISVCSGSGTLSPGETDSGIDQFDTWSIIWPAFDMKVNLTIILILSLTERG